MQLRVRHPQGVTTISDVGSDCSVAELQRKIVDQCGVPVSSQTSIRIGYPPKLLDLGAGGTTLAAAGITSGETLILSAAASQQRMQPHKFDDDRQGTRPGSAIVHVPAQGSNKRHTPAYQLEGALHVAQSDFLILSDELLILIATLLGTRDLGRLSCVAPRFTTKNIASATAANEGAGKLTIVDSAAKLVLCDRLLQAAAGHESSDDANKTWLWRLWEANWLRQANRGDLATRIYAMDSALAAGWGVRLALQVADAAELRPCSPRGNSFVPLEQQFMLSSGGLADEKATLLCADLCSVETFNQNGNCEFQMPIGPRREQGGRLSRCGPGRASAVYSMSVSVSGSAMNTGQAREYRLQYAAEEQLDNYRYYSPAERWRISQRDNRRDDRRGERPFYWQLRAVLVIESVKGRIPQRLEYPVHPSADPLRHRWCEHQYCGATFTAGGHYVRTLRHHHMPQEPRATRIHFFWKVLQVPSIKEGQRMPGYLLVTKYFVSKDPTRAMAAPTAHSEVLLPIKIAD